ncbi:hypothetical protein GY12_16755 [Micrococcus luteus]|nr:hypothetical protein GY12_16755 [Micrococcus luteus]
MRVLRVQGGGQLGGAEVLEAEVHVQHVRAVLGQPLRAQGPGRPPPVRGRARHRRVRQELHVRRGARVEGADRAGVRVLRGHVLDGDAHGGRAS